MPIKMIPLAKIKPQHWAQARESINPIIVDEYADLLKAGAKFPPIVLFHDGKEFFGGDGMHRTLAAAKNKAKAILADVRRGGVREATLYAVAANEQHGLRRSHADKRRAVTILLKDKEWAQWSDREIARRCLVTHPFVAGIRAELLSGNESRCARVAKRHGKTYLISTENIGAQSALLPEVRKLLRDTPLADVTSTALEQLARIRPADQLPVAKLMLENPGMTASQAKRKIARDTRRKSVDSNAAHASIDDCTFIVGNFIKKADQLPRGKFRLAFFDPPYNLGFKYADDPTRDRMSPKDYAKIIRGAVETARELLTPDGTLCVMICEEHIDLFGQIIRAAGFHVRRLIVWFESFGQAGNRNFGRTTRFIWYATKSKENFAFNEHELLTKAKRETVYDDKRVMPGGKVLDSLWEDCPRVCGTYGERVPDEGVPTQLPEKLVKRIVAGFTDPGDSVVDFFGGTGTTARAALSLGRKCVLIDRSKKYMNIARRELQAMVAKSQGEIPQRA